MDIEKIITIVCAVLAVGCYVLALYQKIKGDTTAAVSELIAQAENTGLLGPEKMKLVVGWLYERIPAVFKGILNEEALERIAQGIFDYMRKYANAYIDSKHGGEEAFEPVNDELASDVAKMLDGLGPTGLKALAKSLGIEVEGKTDAELIKEIAYKVMKDI